MRVIYSTPLLPALFNGTLEVDAKFELVLYEPDESVISPEVGGALGRPAWSGKHTLADLRSRGGGRVRIPPPLDCVGVSAVEVPESVLSSLPDTTAFGLTWSFTPRAKP
jgi:hypothetical protein